MPASLLSKILRFCPAIPLPDEDPFFHQGPSTRAKKFFDTWEYGKRNSVRPPRGWFSTSRRKLWRRMDCPGSSIRLPLNPLSNDLSSYSAYLTMFNRVCTFTELFDQSFKLTDRMPGAHPDYTSYTGKVTTKSDGRQVEPKEQPFLNKAIWYETA